MWASSSTIHSKNPLFGFAGKDWLLYSFIIFYPFIVFSVFFSRDSIPFWIVILMLLFVTAEMVRTRGDLWIDRSIIYLILFLLAYIIATYMTLLEDSGMTWLGRSTFDRAVGTTIRVFYVVAAFSVFFNLLAGSSEILFDRIFRLQVWCGVAIALFGILQYLSYTFLQTDVLNEIQPTNETFGKGSYFLQKIGHEKVFRASAFFKEPSYFGIFLVPLVIKVLVTYSRGLYIQSRYIHLGLIVIYFVAILVNFSITAILTLCILGCIYLMNKIIRSPIIGFFVFIIIIGFIFIFIISPIGTALIDRFVRIIEFKDASAIDRTVRAYTSFVVFIEHFWFGVGPGGYAFYYPQMGGLDTSTMVTPSNIWLNFLTDVGLIGFIPFVFFLGRILLRGARESKRHPLISAYFWSVVSFLILLTTNDLWFIEILWFELAMLLVLSSRRIAIAY